MSILIIYESSLMRFHVPFEFILCLHVCVTFFTICVDTFVRYQILFRGEWLAGFALFACSVKIYNVIFFSNLVNRSVGSIELKPWHASYFAIALLLFSRQKLCHQFCCLLWPFCLLIAALPILLCLNLTT